MISPLKKSLLTTLVATVMVLFSFNSHGQPATTKTAVVSGLSIGGLMATAILAKSGYHVDAFETRHQYTRNLQWDIRQPLVDQLAAIDPKLAQAFIAQVATPISKGVYVNYNGKKDSWVPDAIEPGDPTRVPTTGEEMLYHDVIANVECKVFEKLLWSYINTLPSVTLHNQKAEIGAQDISGNFSVVGIGTPDIIVLSEGGSSRNRELVGIKSVAVSPAQTQIAGELMISFGGKVIERRDTTNYRHGLAISGKNKTWLVATLTPEEIKQIENGDAFLEKIFRERAAYVLEMPLSKINQIEVHGPFEGRGPLPFVLQEKISTSAIAGKNVLGLGDFVGNGHWKVGGGMQTAAIAHAVRLTRLLSDLDARIDKQQALTRYNKGVFEDTLVWLKEGLVEFYPLQKELTVTRAFNKAIREWRAGNIENPLELIDQLLSGQKSTLQCMDLFTP